MEVKINATPIEDNKEKEKKYGKFDQWEIDCAVRTLIEAEEIKADTEKMKYVKPLLKEKAAKLRKAVSNLDDLRALAQGEDVYEDDESED